MKRRLLDELPDYLSPPIKLHQTASQLTYVDTIRPLVLDFDQPVRCSVTLATTNVFCCLVCGKYFKGGSMGTPAYTHAVETSHHLFISFESHEIRILPDNFDLTDRVALKAIEPVLQCLDSTIDISGQERLCLVGKSRYIPGEVGLTGDHAINAVIQLFAHTPCIRNNKFSGSVGEALLFVIRRLWSPHLLRRHVSPQRVVEALGKPATSVVMAFTVLVNKLAKENPDIKKTFRGRFGDLLFWMLLVQIAPQLVFKEETVDECDLGQLVKEKYPSLKKYPQELVIVIDKARDPGGVVVVTLPLEMAIGNHRYKLLGLVSYQQGQWVASAPIEDDWFTFSGTLVKPCTPQVLFMNDNRLSQWTRID